MKGPSFRAQLFLRVLRQARFGTVAITFPNGKKELFGEGSPTIHAQISDWGVFDLLFQKGDLGLAEAIIEGTLIVDDIASLIEWACRNDQALGANLYGTWRGTLAAKIRHLLSPNTRSGARKNVMAHYDLGNDFYRLWLDSSMTYSSAIFRQENEALNVGQQAKFNRILDQLNVKPGDHLLEIGSGWGGFFSHAVETRDCRVTAVMNSPEQAKHNAALIAKRGFGQNVKLQQCDYRDIEGKFDKVVSIEMIEAVGEAYWGNFFAKVSASLGAKGDALIQAITIREDLFYSYRKSPDFVQHYVFPGGMLLTNGAIGKNGEKNGLNLGNTFEFGASYAQTLSTWKQNFRSAVTEVKALGFDDRFIRLWDLYLAYCEGAFRAGRINVGQFHLAR